MNTPRVVDPIDDSYPLSVTELCDNGSNVVPPGFRCLKKSPDGAWFCSLWMGHGGRHHAYVNHMLDGFEASVWP